MTFLNRLYQILNVPLLWLILFVFSVVVLLQTSLHLKHENNRLRNNQEALLHGLKRIELANGPIAQEQSVLTLQMRELNKQYPNVAQEMKALGIAKRKVAQYAQTAVQSKLQIETSLRDSFNQSPLATTIDTFPYRLFNYEDSYYSIEGRSFQDKQLLNISNRDTLVQVVYRERKRKWLWIFSPFIYRQRIQCKNPNASIHYAQIIQIQK